MKGVLWSYEETIDRKNSDGNVGIALRPSKQQLLKFLFISIRSAIDDNKGGTSITYVNLQLESSASVNFAAGEDTALDLPSDDYISTFKKIPLEVIILNDGDYAQIYRTHKGSANGEIMIAIRAILNIYAIPTISYTDAANNERKSGSQYHNKMIGIIE